MNLAPHLLFMVFEDYFKTPRQEMSDIEYHLNMANKTQSNRVVVFVLPATFSNAVQVHAGYTTSVIYKGYMSIP